MLAITFKAKFMFTIATAMAKHAMLLWVLWISKLSIGIIMFMPVKWNITIEDTIGPFQHVLKSNPPGDAAVPFSRLLKLSSSPHAWLHKSYQHYDIVDDDGVAAIGLRDQSREHSRDGHEPPGNAEAS